MRVQTSESHRAYGDPVCLHSQPSLPGCNTLWQWWSSGEPLCWDLVCTQSLAIPCRLVANPFLGSHLPDSQVVWLWWVKGVRTQLPAAVISLKP